TGHLRLLVLDGTEIVGVVHARDAIEAGRDATAQELMRESLSLEHDLLAADACRRMREARAHLVVVEHSQHPGCTDAAEVRGVVTLDDGVRRLLPVTS